MAFVVVQKFNGAAPDAAGHGAFLKAHADTLRAFGPISRDGKQVGYMYFTDRKGVDEARDLVAKDPLSGGSKTTIRRWRSRLDRRQADTPDRPGTKGFFMFAEAVDDGARRREGVLLSHREYFHRFDDDHFVSKGPVLKDDGETWDGTALLIEFADRAGFDTFLRNEPFNANGLFKTVEVYDWTRGRL